MPKYKITFSRTIREHHEATVTASNIAEIMRRLEEGDIATIATDSALLSESPARVVEEN